MRAIQTYRVTAPTESTAVSKHRYIRVGSIIGDFLAAAALHYLAGVVSAYHFPSLHLQQFYQDKIYMIGVQKWSYD